jgi:hypothetical protein
MVRACHQAVHSSLINAIHFIFIPLSDDVNFYHLVCFSILDRIRGSASHKLYKELFNWMPNLHP